MAEAARKTLTISEKIKILDRIKDGDARATIMLDTGIKKRTLQRILSTEDEIRKAAASFSPSTKALGITTRSMMQSELVLKVTNFSYDRVTSLYVTRGKSVGTRYLGARPIGRLRCFPEVSLGSDFDAPVVDSW